MDNNVKIILGDGNVLDAVGISYIHIDASNKDYIFYSLNELANGNMDKIYIAEASQNGTTPGPISDEEWDNIKKIMLNISHNEAVAGISYKPLIGLNFNVGEAKKLAIKGDKKQAFIDAQNKAVAPTVSVDEPAFVSEQAANGNPFFASDVNAEGKQVIAQPETVVPSAFAMNPPVEQEIPVESLDNETSQPIVQTIIQPAVAPQTEQVITPVIEQPAIEQPVIEQPAVDQLIQNVLEDAPAITPPQLIENSMNDVLDVAPSTVVSEPTTTETRNTINNIDELKQAIVDVQNAINKMNEYIASVENKSNTVVVSTTQVQTISTGQGPVATESMNIAEQPEIKTDNLGEESILSDTQPGFVGTPVMQENEMLINTGIETNEILNTSVINTLNEDVSVSVTPTVIEPTVDSTVAINEEPAIVIDNQAQDTPTINLNAAHVVSTPNSAIDINSSTVEVAIPAAPAIDINTPQIPISPIEANGIPTVSPVQTIEPVQTITPILSQAVTQTVLEPVQPVQELIPQPDQQTSVQTVPEIGAVQQVPIVDLSSINTDVTLPTDMVANPNPNPPQEGILGPATLDAQTDITA